MVEKKTMNTKQYLAAISKFDEGYNGDWNILATSKDGTLFLAKDSNNICYVSTPDLVTMMPYHLALVEQTLVHFAVDSPIDCVIDAVKDGKMSPDKIVGVGLTAEDLAWLKSEDISGMVRSIESHN
jgi:hypothetical protein